MVEDVGGGAVAGYDGRWCIGGGVRKLLAELLCVGGVVEFGGAGEGDCLVGIERLGGRRGTSLESERKWRGLGREKAW